MFNKNWFLLLLTALITLASVSFAAYTVKPNNRIKFNLDYGWKIIVGDPSGAQATTFNDAAWKSVTLPYAWNENDAFKVKGSSVTQGIAWYRKHFVLPATYAGRKAFVEFEEIRQAGQVYCNGTSVGLSENGVMASGFDITPYVKFDGTDNVIAVRIDNSYAYTEAATGTRFQWCTGSYTTNFGGITQNAYLHITDKCYQTLPLFTNLKTVGTYIYGQNYNISGQSATITATSQVKNETAASESVTFQTDIVDKDGNLLKTLSATPQDVAAGATATVTATGSVNGLNFWNIGYGYLYDVYTMLIVNGAATDVVKTKTGFRKLEHTGGLTYINDRMMHLKGFAWRSQNPWPAIGDAVPMWMVGFQDSLLLGVHGNAVRPMHVAALRQEIETADRMGVTYAMPAGDAEDGSIVGRQWTQRKEVMRDAMIYSRNNPSILYWEGGNSDISEAYMQELIDTAKKFDPLGGRATGCRGMLNSKVAQYGGEMLYVNKSKSIPRWMMEYSRDESPRRWWDEFSPPDMHPDDQGTSTVAGMNRNQDSHIREEVLRWSEYWTERPGSVYGTGARFNAGGVKIEFCDGTTFARSDENYRRSGICDAMRIPKDTYGAFRVMWNGWVEVDNKDVYIVGHWTYPTNTKKNTEYVVSNCDKVELFVNNVSKGFGVQTNKFLFTFQNVPFVAGTIKAVGYTSSGTQVAQDQRTTAGAAAKLVLTPHTSAAGLRATGGDFALIDVEVQDANGNRCPTANNTITWLVTGPAEYRGGMAGGNATNYILAPSFPVECGQSRISIRASTTPGTITVTASATGLSAGTATLTSTAFPLTDGLTTVMPSDGLPLNLTPLPPYQLSRKAYAALPVTASGGGSSYDDNETTSWSGSSITYNLTGSLPVAQVHIKFSDFKNSHTFKITVGSTQAWSSSTPGGLGYADATFSPVTGSTVTISSSGSFGITEAEIYGGAVGTQPLLAKAELSSTLVKKYPDRVNIVFPGQGYSVNMVDLFGRIVFENIHQEKGVGALSISTKKFARGVYLINLLKNDKLVQREKLFIQ